MNHIGVEELFSALSEGFSDEELTLALLQASIASEITVRRAKRGMNQAQLAELMGVSQGLVSRWENGETNFTLETLVKIASKLDIEIQCPFKLEPAPTYGHAEGKIITFPGSSSSWSSANYKSSNIYDQLKEM